MLLHWWRYTLSSDKQFSIPGYRIIKRDRNQNDGGIFFYTDENISFSSDRQFLIHGYPIIRKDRNKDGGGICFYIDEDISFQVVADFQYLATA